MMGGPNITEMCEALKKTRQFKLWRIIPSTSQKILCKNLLCTESYETRHKEPIFHQCSLMHWVTFYFGVYMYTY